MTDTNQEVRETTEALRAFSDAATPGQAWCDGDTADVYFCDPPGSSFRPDSVLVARCATGDDYKRNARFIAECVNHVRAALASAPPPAVPDAVGVRATRLTRERHRNAPASHRAVAGIGQYRIVVFGDKAIWGFAGSNEGRLDQTAENLEAAKAAAQADFDRRILSSIEPTPSPEPQDDPTVDLMLRVWMNLYYDEADAGYTFQGTLNDVVDWLAARNALPSVDDPVRDRTAVYETAGLLERAEKAERINDKLRSELSACEVIMTAYEQLGTSPEPQASNAGAVEALRSCIEVIDDYLAYRHDGDPYREDARIMGEMEINRFARDGRLKRAREAAERRLAEVEDQV